MPVRTSRSQRGVGGRRAGVSVKRPKTVWYRVVSRRAVARKEFLRSLRGRFHEDPETEPTTYVADSPETAWLEVSVRFGQVAGDPDAFRLFRVALSGARLVDLRSQKERDRHQISEEDLSRDPPPARCKEVSRKLRRPDTGYEGLIYPSLRNRPHGVCATLFLERVKGIVVEPADEEWQAFRRRKH